MRKLASVVLVTACLALGMVSCGDDDATGVEGTGTLEVLTMTAGDTLDLDGYTVSLDGATSQSIGVGHTLRFSDLPAGSHTVELGDVAVNCRVDASNPQTVTVDAGLTTHAVFPVSCRAALFDRIGFASTGGPALCCDFYAMDADGSNPVRLTGLTIHPLPVISPAWSPDGTRIAFGGLSDGNYDIYVIDTDSSNLTRLTVHPADDAWPAWSPDGTRIAFQSNRDGRLEIYVVNADGSNLVRLTDDNGAYPTWSPDGTRIAFVSSRTGWPQIHVMDADGSNVVRLTDTSLNKSFPAWSPDGTRIAFGSGIDIYVMDADGSNLEVLTEGGGNKPAWSPDGTRIAFHRPVGVGSSWADVCVIDADGSNFVNLTNQPSSIDRYASWSPGSQQR